MTATSTTISTKRSNGLGSIASVAAAGIAAALIGLVLTARPVVAPNVTNGAAGPAVVSTAADPSETYVQGIRARSGQAISVQGRTYHTALLEKHPARTQGRTYHTALLERHPKPVNVLSAWDPYRGK